jgi:hypothetical protein
MDVQLVSESKNENAEGLEEIVKGHPAVEAKQFINSA